jgi:hypothetical protein
MSINCLLSDHLFIMTNENIENNSVPPTTIAPIHQTTATPLDEPPPAYEITPTASNQETIEEVSVNEAPPPYCLVDPSKIRNTDHLPQYSHIAPVEIIELNTRNEQPSRHNQPAIAAWLVSGSNMDIGTDCTFLMAL